MALETELATYKARLHEWKEHEGQFVLIQGSEVVEFFSSYEDAIKVGYDKFELQPFFVKQIQAVEAISTRFLTTVPVIGAALAHAHGIHALIGRDILGQCVLHYNGATGMFTLAF